MAAAGLYIVFLPSYVKSNPLMKPLINLPFEKHLPSRKKTCMPVEAAVIVRNILTKIETSAVSSDTASLSSLQNEGLLLDVVVSFVSYMYQSPKHACQRNHCEACKRRKNTVGPAIRTCMSAMSISWPPSTKPHSSIWNVSSSLAAVIASCTPRWPCIAKTQAGISSSSSYNKTLQCKQCEMLCL